MRVTTYIRAPASVLSHTHLNSKDTKVYASNERVLHGCDLKDGGKERESTITIAEPLTYTYVEIAS